MAALIPGLGATELIIILVIILILFGPKRLPQLGKSLGKTMRAIREGSESDADDDDDDEPVAKAKASKSDPSDADDEDEA